MADGWLIRCDPVSRRIDAETRGAASIARAESSTALVEGGTRSAGALLQEYLLQGEPSLDPGFDAASAAIWDGRLGTLHLVRDRTGLRPLFHGRRGSTVVAGTSAAEVIAAGVSAEPNAAVAAEWIAGIPSPPDETLLAELRRVPAGHILSVDADSAPLRRFWEPPATGSLDAVEAERFGDVLEHAVGRALAGRRCACFLSGGIDSASITLAAVRTSRAGGNPDPLALSVEFEGASEADVQRAVASSLGIPQHFGQADGRSLLLLRSLKRVSTALWPVGALWQPVFDDLALRARDEGAEVVIDGQGGDELLDATLMPGIDLLRGMRVLALARLVRANTTYTGEPVHAALRRIGGSIRGKRSDTPPLPAWLAPDRRLRTIVEERRPLRPSSYAEMRRSDLVDSHLAHAREETFAAEARHGIAYRHPLFDPEVVELLDGVPPQSLVVGGEAKSPARRYLRTHLPEIDGPWPRPAVASGLLTSTLDDELDQARGTVGSLRALADLGVLKADQPYSTFRGGQLWTILSLEYWLRSRWTGEYA